MAVIPRIINTLERLHPRATTNNGLGDGAIAGIVLGSVFGLLFILIIFWIWRFGSGIVTTAKQLSRTVTDKAEKVHARANGLYTAGRDRQHQSPKFDDEAHYEDPDVELTIKPEASISPVTHVDTAPAAYVPLRHGETSDHGHPYLGPFTIRTPIRSVSTLRRSCFSISAQHRPRVSTPPAKEKPVVVDAEHHASYLDALPIQSGKRPTTYIQTRHRG
jgi:hypothetical protein